MEKNEKDIATGILFAVLSSVYGLSILTELSIGELRKMGPGFFPLIVCVVILLIGAALISKGIYSKHAVKIGGLSLRGPVVVAAAILIFGSTINGLGLFTTLFVVVLISAFASKNVGILPALATATIMSVFCTVLFVYVLRLPMPAFGPWLVY